MDFREAEKKFGQLQENYQNGAISEEAFQKAVSKLMFQDSQGRYWAIDAETGGWLSYDGHAWQGAVPSTGDATERIPRVQPRHPPQKTWLFGAAVGALLLFGFLLIVGLIAYWKWNGSSLPEVAILSPVHGEEFEVNQDVTIEARCSDSTGVSRVELWVDDAMVIPETNLPAGSSIPVTLHWMFHDSGLHTLKLKAYNADGEAGLSEPVVVRAVASTRLRGPTVALLEGSFEIKPGGATDWSPAENGATIKAGEAVRTGKDGRVQVVLADGLVAELGDNSELLLKTIQMDSGQGLYVRIESPYGDTWHRLDAGSVPVHYEVETPTALIALHGTLVHVTTLPDGGTFVEVVEGDAVVVGAEERQQVIAGQATRVEPGQPPVLVADELPQQLEDTGSATPVCVSDAMLQADVSLPEDTVLRPGERVEKIWRVRNTGTCPWIGYTWAFESGDSLSETPVVAVPRTEPGGTADIGVPLQAPREPDSYEAQWRLKDAAGHSVGPAARITIRVQGELMPDPTPDADLHPVMTPSPFVRFLADRERLDPGECAILEWDVEHVDAVYLDGSPAVGHDTREVCPSETTPYTLCWHLEDEEECQTITVTVSSAPSPPHN